MLTHNEIHVATVIPYKQDDKVLFFEKVMNDKDFQTESLEKKSYFHKAKDSNQSLSTISIVYKLYNGKESHQTEFDHETDIYWQVKKLKTTTIGSGYPSKKMIYIKPNFINKGNIAEIAGHIAHEWTHKFYFIDGNYRGKKRKYMVSYSFGYLVRKHAAKYL